MEEIKNKKKLNKKPLLICLAIALVFAVIGFIDIKSNAAESVNRNTLYYKSYFYYNNEFEYEYFNELGIPYESDSPITVYHNVVSEPITGDNRVFIHLVSKSPIIQVGQPYISDTITDVNGNEWFYMMNYVGSEHLSSGYSTYHDVWFEGAENVYVLNRQYMADDFIEFFSKGELDVKVDYNSFEVDDDMPAPTNIKRNIIKNEIKDSLNPNTLGGETYDYITWTNTSETYSLQLQVVPVVQYFDIRLTENIFTKEFYGEWNTQAIYEEVTNSFTLCTFTTNPDTLLKYPLFTSGLSFKSECNDKYSKGIFEENYLKFGYRIRYVDIENEKASPWLVLVPTKELDDYKTFVEYADNSISDSTDGNGLFNEYENLDDIENAKTDIKTENEFKDKYEIVDGDVDTQEATNWLYSVVNFIKGTPQVVGSVLGFLPQPILYGMYVCIFLGIIASGIAIVKALL